MPNTQERFMRDAAGTVDAYFCDALDIIDKHRPESAKKNLLVASILTVAMALDCFASTVFRHTETMTHGLESVIGSVDDLSAKFN